ncbi:MAG: putative quinol monooxygenase [Pseudomonadota bacterium]
MKFIIKSFVLSSLVLFNAGCKFESASDQDSKAKDAPVQAEDLSKLPSDPTKSFVNLVTVKIKSELLSEFLSVLTKYAATTRLEPGVAEYKIHQSPNDPSVIVLYEVYKNTQARETHNASEHRNEFFKTVKEKGYFAAPASSVILYLIDPIDAGQK